MKFVDLVLKYINMVTIVDVIDILIVAFVIYRVILLIKETRAQTLVKGILLLVVVMQLSGWFGLNTINYLLQNMMQLSVFALLVVFQPEIRRALELVGRSRLTSGDLFNFDIAVSDAKINYTIEQICQAAHSMSAVKIGALIVIERDTKIGEIISTGTVVDAQISAELIRNIFYPKSPLHDGAVVIRNNRISAAGCFLPLSQQQDGISRELGTRHRAALGMSECSDAIIVVVSEETGKISAANNGMLIRNLTSKSLYSILYKALSPVGDAEKKPKFWQWRETKK
jgi:diadenylate cyclase